jgi:hypothetical protein
MGFYFSVDENKDGRGSLILLPVTEKHKSN